MDITSTTQTICPLSGHGKFISYELCSNKINVKWGNTKFSIYPDMLDSIIKNFFKSDDKWYALGASMTIPVKGGLGEYIALNHPGFSPRHASAIAAIMVNEGMIKCKLGKMIELRRVK